MKLITLLLFIGLNLTGLTGQNFEGVRVDVELSVLKEDSVNVIPKLFFPDLAAGQIANLSEIYIEFKLSAEIVDGSEWPYFILSAHCVHLENDSVIGRITDPVPGRDATHFLRISDPAELLKYDPYVGVYYFDLFEGFCRTDIPFEMIGYVDVILYASGQWGTNNENPSGYCAQFSLDLTHVIFTTIGGEERYINELGSDELVYGSDCIDPGKTGGYRQKSEVFIPQNNRAENSTDKLLTFIYPNPASTHLIIDNLSTTNQALLQLYTTGGQLIKTQNIKTGKTEWLTDNLSSSLYWLKITSDNQSTFYKVMISK